MAFRLLALQKSCTPCQVYWLKDWSSMLPTSVTKATSVLLPEVEAAASEVASVVVLAVELAGVEPPQAARESAMLAAITKARNFFMVLISLG